MKKISGFVLLVIALAFAISCNGSPSKSNSSGTISSISSVLYDMSSISCMKANISSNTTAIGTQTKVSRSLDSEKILVKQDGENSESEPVEFEVVSTKDKDGNPVKDFNGNTLQLGDIFTQNSINGKIDKIYVSVDYTFVSYLTVDVNKMIENSSSNGSDSWHNGTIQSGKESLSWNWSDSNDYINVSYSNSNYYCYENISYKSSRYDEPAYNEADGVSKYDVNGYQTNKFKQSFIIDNKTGLIYPIEEGLNLSLQKGVAIDKEKGPLSIKRTNDDSLVLEQLLPNKDIRINRVFKD